MKGVNVFDVMIHNKTAELLRVPNDYLWERSKAKTFEDQDAALHKANLAFFNIKQEINSLSDLRNRLSGPEYLED